MILYCGQVSSQHNLKVRTVPPLGVPSKASEDLDVFGAADFTTQGARSEAKATAYGGAPKVSI